MLSKTLVLRFPPEAVDKPIISNLVRQYDLEFNILRANIYPRREGLVVVQFTGRRDQYEKGIKYLKQEGLRVEHMSQEVQRNNELCYQCGACTAVCPTHALHIVRPEMEVHFDSELCSGCELCTRACPANAMTINMDRMIEL